MVRAIENLRLKEIAGLVFIHKKKFFIKRCSKEVQA
jgi:hypothetical protein